MSPTAPTEDKWNLVGCLSTQKKWLQIKFPRTRFLLKFCNNKKLWTSWIRSTKMSQSWNFNFIMKWKKIKLLTLKRTKLKKIISAAKATRKTSQKYSPSEKHCWFFEPCVKFELQSSNLSKLFHRILFMNQLTNSLLAGPPSLHGKGLTKLPND